MNRLFLSLVTGLLLLPAVPASAASIPYSSELAFMAATGATPHPLPAGPNGSYVKANTFTSTDAVLSFTALGNDMYSNWEKYPGVGVDRLAGPELAISNRENLDAAVASGAARYAFGFGIYEPSGDGSLKGCNTACVESVFTITLKNDGAVVASPFIFAPANNQPQFWGVHTDFAFDAVQIRETTGGIDNELFGTFYTGMTAVPEPGSLLLLGVGLITIARQLRRRA